MGEPRELCAVGQRVWSETDGSFSFGIGGLLCAACATARGGRYDAAHDRWEVEPDLSGLPDEAYGAAPHERRGG